MQNFRRKMHLALLRLLGKEKLEFAPHGIVVHVPRDADLKLRYNLSRGRPYEEDEADMIRTYLRPNTPVIELGGCLGIISALVRQQIGPTAHHIVVEANPRLAQICEPNAKIGAAEGATQVVVAAVDYSGAKSVSFSTGETAHGGHVSQNGDIAVATTTLASLANTLPDGPFALICDIEGAELAMIEHDAGIISRIMLLVLETHPKAYAKGDEDTAKIIGLIEKTGLRQVAKAKNVFAFTR